MNKMKGSYLNTCMAFNGWRYVPTGMAAVRGNPAVPLTPQVSQKMSVADSHEARRCECLGNAQGCRRRRERRRSCPSGVFLQEYLVRMQS
jgi:hypothetical protein